MGSEMCIRDRYYVRSAGVNVGGSVVDIFWKTEVIGKLYYVRSLGENVGGSVLDILRKTEVIGKMYYTFGPPTKRGWYTRQVFFRSLGFDFFVVVSCGGWEAELEILNGCL